MKKYFVFLLILASILVKAEALDLKESIKVAVKQNPTVIASQKKAAAAGARLNQALSTFFPTVNLSGNYDQAYSSPTNVQITTQTTTGAVTQNIAIGTDAAATVSSLQAALSQPVFVASLFPSYGIARKGAESASEDLQQTIINTYFDVTQTYFGVLLALKLEVLMEESLAMANSHLAQVQSMLNAGMATKADYLRSKVRSANANVDLIKSKYNIAISKDAFNNAMGYNQKQSVDLKDEGFSGKVSNLPEYDTLLEIAYVNRPDWKMYLLSTGIKEDQVRLSQSEYLPSIMLSANSGSQSTKYPTFQSDVSSWKVAGVGSWKLFDSLGRENRVKEASENLSAQQANVQQLKNDIDQEVHDAYLNLKSALDTVDSTKQAVESAEESYKVTTARYNSGMGTNTDVLDSQVDLTQAETAYLQALFEVEIARARINKSVGKAVI
ncbi:MAG: TolC family protein [Candidatus Margulisiibacteriota bacterium]